MSSKNKAEKNLQGARFVNLNLNEMWCVFDQPIGTFVYFFVRYENFALYHKKSFFTQILDVTVIKELVQAFSCAYIELWMHSGSLESTQEARVALGYRLMQILHIFHALQTSRVHP